MAGEEKIMQVRSLEQVLQWTGGQPLNCPQGLYFAGLSTDSRQVAPGDLYIALPGEHFDGHFFLKEAEEKGAAAAVVSRSVPGTFPMIKVEDTLLALQAIAAGYRRQFSLPLIAVTGSVGKTTTKDILAHILQTRYQVMKTQGNYNNEIGLPLTLLQLSEQHTAAVLEMGMRAPGEIAELSRISAPQYGMITNVEPVHLETLGSLEAIAEAKCELLGALPPEGFCLLAGDNALLRRTAGQYAVTQYTFGFSADCDIRLHGVQTSPTGMTFTAAVFDQVLEASFPLPSEPLAVNVVAAAGMAYKMGIPMHEIKTALATFSSGASRLDISPLPEGGLVINDTYNANPASMRNALAVLSAVGAGRKTVAVLGDMLELGGYTEAGHRAVGEKATELKIDRLVTVGEKAALIGQAAVEGGFLPSQVQSFIYPEDCVPWLQQHVSRSEAVLFKASRGMKLEKILDAWVSGGTY
jgi:UDP-N-acetylmuramoyl-tripeptide--D-alanyl-D-alanine ligase